MENDQLKEITDRLDKLIQLVALSSIAELTMTNKIRLLAKCSFKPAEIAEIVGTSPHVVSVRLSEMKKKKET